MEEIEALHIPVPSPVETSKTALVASSLKGTLEWEIDRFLELGKAVGTSMESPDLILEKCQFHLRLYPGGEKQESFGFLSLFGITALKYDPPIKEASYHYQVYFHAGNNVEPFYSSRKFLHPVSDNKGSWGVPKFISNDTVKQALNESTLRIVCNVEMILWRVSSKHEMIPVPLELSTDLFNILNMNPVESFSDVTFIINKKRIHAHKVILAARCKVFRVMFTSKMAEGTVSPVVEIEDADDQAFQEMLHFIYTGKCDQEILDHKTVELLVLADRYDLPSLRTVCEDALMQNLSLDTVGKVLALADVYQSSQLKQAALEYISLNSCQVLPAPQVHDGPSKTKQENIKKQKGKKEKNKEQAEKNKEQVEKNKEQVEKNKEQVEKNKEQPPDKSCNIS